MNLQNIRSLGFRTDFLFNQFDGSVEDKGEYVVAKTASNPNYFWGNLLLFKKPPQEGDFERWTDLFESEFKEDDVFHKTLAWDSPSGEKGEVEEFTSKGFDFDNSVVLTARELELPRKFNPEIEMCLIDSEEDFEKTIEIQVSCAHDHLSKESWESFYRQTLKQYRKMIAHNRGQWFGAKVDGELAGTLGIFTDANVGRFQIVSTSPKHQRRGVCSTLVYKSAEYAMSNMGVDTLVMVADDEYHAAKIYESVGFKPTERIVGLCWWDKERYS